MATASVSAHTDGPAAPPAPTQTGDSSGRQWKTVGPHLAQPCIENTPSWSCWVPASSPQRVRNGRELPLPPASASAHAQRTVGVSASTKQEGGSGGRSPPRPERNGGRGGALRHRSEREGESAFLTNTECNSISTTNRTVSGVRVRDWSSAKYTHRMYSLSLARIYYLTTRHNTQSLEGPIQSS